MISGYERLLALTRAQRDMLADGRLDEAIALGDAWQQLVDALPAQAPAEALDVLEQAQTIAWSNQLAIEAAASAVVEELATIDRGRRALASYATAGQ